MRGATVLLKVSATAWALWSAGQAYGQCADTTTTLWYETTAVRMNGNAVRLNGQTRITGDYDNWWYTEADAAFYFNNTREDLSGWYHSNTLGGELDLGYTPTLQTYGAARPWNANAGSVCLVQVITILVSTQEGVGEGHGRGAAAERRGTKRQIRGRQKIGGRGIPVNEVKP